jgi:hypothetical protein
MVMTAKRFCIPVVALAAFSCHPGGRFGVGTSCGEQRPCRGGLACVHGLCQPPDGPASQLPDGSVDQLPDGSVGQGICSSRDPFLRVAKVPGIADSYARTPRLSPDEKTIYFSSNRDQGSDHFEIFSATRPSRFEPFGSATHLFLEEDRPTSGGDTTLSAAANGLTLFFESTRNGPFEIWWAARTARDAAFSTVAVLSGIDMMPNGRAWHGGPYFLDADNVLYFHSQLALTGDNDVYRGVWTGLSVKEVKPVAGINTPRSDVCPVVTTDELTIYYGIEMRTEGTGSELYDIWMATRSSRQDAFSDPRPLQELNMPSATDAPGWISPDNCRLYIFREDSAGARIFVAERSPR